MRLSGYNPIINQGTSVCIEESNAMDLNQRTVCPRTEL